MLVARHTHLLTINSTKMKLKITSLTIFIFLSFLIRPEAAPQNDLETESKKAMLNATKYMVEEVSTNGGYVRHYHADLSRRWGEIEAYETQIWVQGSGGTVDMGHIFLDAYHATGDEYYYKAAEKAANALIWGQHESGGWNYLVDFAGDRSLTKWYNTIGKNAWGFEEFYHYYGNATFDDFVTTGAAQFILRIYLKKLDPKYKPALYKAIDFILESQYDLGGWPQRDPPAKEFSKDGLPDYTTFYTFNDEVIRDNIDFLIKCYELLGEERFLDPIRRGMNFYLITQQGNPQGGWGLQYNMKLEPASARSYEPPSLQPATTYNHAMLLMKYYKLTGDRRFLARIPDAIEWLENTRLPDEASVEGRFTHARNIEVGTNKPLYVHRSGSNVKNGKYWWDYNDDNLIRHYGQKATVNVEHLREEYEKVSSLSSEEATVNSPLKNGEYQGEETPQQSADLGLGFSDNKLDETEVRSIINGLDGHGRWITNGESTSDPFSISASGEESNTALYANEFGSGIQDQINRQYISTRVFVRNMATLINFLNQQTSK